MKKVMHTTEDGRSYKWSDFEELVSILENIEEPLEKIEEAYKHITVIKDKCNTLKLNIFPRAKNVLRVILISLIVFNVLFLCIGTNDSSELYYMLDEHLYMWVGVTDVFTLYLDSTLQFFLNTLIVAFLDAMVFSFIVIFMPIIAKGIVLLSYTIRVKSLTFGAEKSIGKNIPYIYNYPAIYMCSYAIDYFINCYAKKNINDFSEAIIQFNEYKKTPVGIVGVASIAPWLHEMRAGLKNIGYIQ